MGVTRHDERGRMKKQPSDTAREQAKTLRREMAEAEKKIWCRLRLRQTEGYRFRPQGHSGALKRPVTSIFDLRYYASSRLAEKAV